MIFESKHCYFFRKPPHLASTRGKQESFLDMVIEQGNASKVQALPGSRETLEKEQQQWFEKEMQSLGITYISGEVAASSLEYLKKTYTKEQEYGLLNRLDTATSGLLYFAKTPEIYTQWKDRQAQEKINKFYIAKVENDLILPPVKGVDANKAASGGVLITTPLAHHTNGKQMIVCTPDIMEGRKKQKIKGKLLPCETRISTTTTLRNDIYAHVMIHKGRRHQIRAHLASVGAPIIGETLYDDSLISPLQLYSIGCIVNASS